MVESVRGRFVTTSEEMRRLTDKIVGHWRMGREINMLRDEPSLFKCRAGGRYLCVNEWRSQPGV